MRYAIEDSIHIEATPQDVYALISDVVRTGEWSPQCRAVEWKTDERGVGARFLGHNSKPGRDWTTESQIRSAQQDEEFSWAVVPAGVVWGYRLAPLAGGTRLTHFTEFSTDAEQFFQAKYGDESAEVMRSRLVDASEGIPQTLQRVKELLEQR